MAYWYCGQGADTHGGPYERGVYKSDYNCYCDNAGVALVFGDEGVLRHERKPQHVCPLSTINWVSTGIGKR